MVEQIIETLIWLAVVVPGFLVAVSFHECAHALVATLLGDPTPRLMGRVTLNPFKHLDFLGTLFLLIFRIGWAKPVIFNPHHFKHRRLYAIITAFAGPIANFMLALLLLYSLKLFLQPPLHLATYFTPIIAGYIKNVVRIAFDINVMLGVFNFLPVPPLDGSHLVTALLPERLLMSWYKMQRYMIFVVIVLFSLPFTREGLSVVIDGVKNLLIDLVF